MLTILHLNKNLDRRRKILSRNKKAIKVPTSSIEKACNEYRPEIKRKIYKSQTKGTCQIKKVNKRFMP